MNTSAVRERAVACHAALALGMLGARFLKSSQRDHDEDRRRREEWSGGAYGGA